MLILGIETSCDETAASLVHDGKTILSNIIQSQVTAHAHHGGIVPELASRMHLEAMPSVLSAALEPVDGNPEKIDAIAVTRGPGLIGSLLVGTTTAQALGYAWNKPVMGINHLAAHLYSVELCTTAKWPALAMVISGGHTDLFLATEPGCFQVLGRTRDDAAGEAFDKSARLLGLGYPGGPIMETTARSGNRSAHDFPLPRFKKSGLDFSFSGLKTQIRQAARILETIEDDKRPQAVADLAASFQKSLFAQIARVLKKAASLHHPEQIRIAGGVSANFTMRRHLQQALPKIEITFPDPQLCTDNAAMVAGLAGQMLMQGKPAAPPHADSNLEL